MYKESTLKQLKNLWNKDEESFSYCMELLRDKLTDLEYNQWMFYYYYVNDKFEKSVDYLVSLKQNMDAKELIEYMASDDFDDVLCCCLPTLCCSECACDTCDDCCCCGELLTGGCGVCCMGTCN